MKYIRTHSEIYDVNDLYICEELADKPYATKNGGWCIYKDSIVKQADTIEELCDEFVCLGSAEYQKYVKHSLKEALQKKEWLERKGYTCNIYGAIWTNKGLIYVVKMKGILPNGEIDWELL